MHFSVSHETLYRYAQPIWLTAHWLRLTPRRDAGILRLHQLIIEPAPHARHEETDAFGNRVEYVAFAGSTDRLRILSQFEIEVTAPSPDGPMALPPLPWSGLAAETHIYLANENADGAVVAFAERIAREAGGEALRFLDRLNTILFSDFRHDIRDNGGARKPSETLGLGHGACRDVTAVFMAACRAQGIPARFVSGYQAHADNPDGRRHLHAWAEAFVPGAGWRGYDPTHGLAVADGHVALCVAPEQWPTMPVEGGYFGAAVKSKLTYEITIKTRKGF